MTTIFDSARPVKPTRDTFGRGILASHPTDSLPCTLDDLRWAAEAFNATADDYDVIDEMAAVEAAALDAIERGLIPPDVAGYISRTSLVGHPA
jgi:hypothetical protein